MEAAKEEERKEGRDRERPYKKGEMVFEKRIPAEWEERAAKNEIEGRERGGGGSQACGVQEELERSEE